MRQHPILRFVVAICAGIGGAVASDLVVQRMHMHIEPTLLGALEILTGLVAFSIALTDSGRGLHDWRLRLLNPIQWAAEYREFELEAEHVEPHTQQKPAFGTSPMPVPQAAAPIAARRPATTTNDRRPATNLPVSLPQVDWGFALRPGLQVAALTTDTTTEATVSSTPANQGIDPAPRIPSAVPSGTPETRSPAPSKWALVTDNGQILFAKARIPVRVTEHGPLRLEEHEGQDGKVPMVFTATERDAFQRMSRLLTRVSGTYWEQRSGQLQMEGTARSESLEELRSLITAG